MPDPSRTDILAAVIARELDHHRDQLDGDSGLRSITLTVKMMADGRTPRAVILHRESERTFNR